MKIVSRIILALTLLVASLGASAQQSSVQWTASLDSVQGNEATLVLKVKIDQGWHIYGIEMPKVDFAPDPTNIQLSNGTAVGALSTTATPSIHKDADLGVDLPWLTGEFELRQRVSTTDGRIEGAVHYMACTEEACTPPAKYEFVLNMDGTVGTETVAVGDKDGNLTALSKFWAPVDAPLAGTSAQSYWGLLLFGFLGGLVALLTPCVWPMIPMTVSFFLKKSKSRRRSIIDASLYSGSIIVIFLVLGIVLTLIFGPGKLNEIATGAVFNLIFFALLVFFAISFFGAFEITLPSKWTNAADSRAENTTGALSIFFMAFTLVLVSFSCTGPIIGTLLVEAASTGDKFGPAVGMFGFALALAIPFCLFSLFPSWLQSAPRSGNWMNTVKVVLGFLELALSLKFLSVADLAYGWRILDREVFLAIWIVLFVLLGIYLLGKLRFSHDSEQGHTSVTRFFMAVISFSFAVYLLPGMWGAPLKAVSAFAPPLYTQDFNLYGGTFSEYHDFDAGMEAAIAENKPVLVDFSGYACVNCRKMEGSVFDNSAVRTIIEEQYIMIKLMVDDKASLPEPMYVEEEGKTVKLTTVGEKWAYLQRHKFGINSQPYYVLLNHEGKPLEAPRAYNENVAEFVAWLENGLVNYAK